MSGEDRVIGSIETRYTISLPQDSSVEKPDLAAAVELSQLIDLESHWENLRNTPRQTHGPLSKEELNDKQKAYQLFHSKLAAYNHRHTAKHIPELLLNTPARLGKWCASMHGLCRKIEPDPKASCPTHLVEKAYRWADKIASRLNHVPVSRSSPPDTIAAVIRDLDAVVQWCAVLQRAAA